MLEVGDPLLKNCCICASTNSDAQIYPCGHYIHSKCWGNRFECTACYKPVKRFAVVQTAASSFATTACSSAASILSLAPSIDDDGDWGWFTTMETETTSQPTTIHYHYPSETIESAECSTNLVRSATLDTHEEYMKTFEPTSAVFLSNDYARMRHEVPWLDEIVWTSPLDIRISVPKFRVAQCSLSSRKFAEYSIVLSLNRRPIIRWMRYSTLHQFVRNELRPIQKFRQAKEEWECGVSSKKRWFNRLDVLYLHQRCMSIERFLHTVAYEASTPLMLLQLVTFL